MLFRDGFGYTAENTHMALVHRAYKIVYGVLAFMAISGMSIYLYQDIGLTKEIAKSIKEVHELMAWGVVIFVVMHIVGVFVADNRDQKGIISRMISG